MAYECNTEESIRDKNLLLLKRLRDGDRTAEAEMAELNMGIVYSLARRFSSQRTEYSDLCQIGSLGLIKAIRNFDGEKGVCFSTYAVPVVSGEIKRFLRDDGPVKVSRGLRELNMRIQREASSLRLVLGREPTVCEIAEKLCISPQEVAEASDAAAVPLSLDLSVSEDGDVSLRDILSDGGEDDGIEYIALREAVRGLTGDDRRIITLRYFASKTQQQVASLLGLTQVQVSRREKKILDALKRRME